MYIKAGMNNLPAGTMNITFAYLLSCNFICICLRCDKVVCSSDIAQNCIKISLWMFHSTGRQTVHTGILSINYFIVMVVTDRISETELPI